MINEELLSTETRYAKGTRPDHTGGRGNKWRTRSGTGHGEQGTGDGGRYTIDD